MIDLWFLDQSGFAPTLPTGYGWERRGTRLVVPYEAPQGRRVNAVGALAPHAPEEPCLLFETRPKGEGRYDAAAHLAIVDRVAAAGTADRPCVVVLDNYSVHHARPVADARPALAARGVTFCFLPPSSPELNPIEAIWKQVKHHDIAERSHPTEAALQAAVDAALVRRARTLSESKHDLPRSA